LKGAAISAGALASGMLLGRAGFPRKVVSSYIVPLSPEGLNSYAVILQLLVKGGSWHAKEKGRPTLVSFRML